MFDSLAYSLHKQIRCLIRSHTRYTNDVCVASMRANQTSNFNQIVQLLSFQLQILVYACIAASSWSFAVNTSLLTLQQRQQHYFYLLNHKKKKFKGIGFTCIKLLKSTHPQMLKSKGPFRVKIKATLHKINNM